MSKPMIDIDDDDYGPLLYGKLLKALTELYNRDGPTALKDTERLCDQVLEKYVSWIFGVKKWKLDEKIDMIRKFKKSLLEVLKKKSDPPSFWRYLVGLAGVSYIALLGAWSAGALSAFFVTAECVTGGIIATGTVLSVGSVVGIYIAGNAIYRRFFNYDENEQKSWLKLIDKRFEDAEKSLRFKYNNESGHSESVKQMLDQVGRFEKKDVEEDSKTIFNMQIPPALGGGNVQYGNSTKTVSSSLASDKKFHIVGA